MIGETEGALRGNGCDLSVKMILCTCYDLS